ncbi:MAG: hypothetical protein RLZZ330_1003 [Actinomycetota bacterium]|jgi:glycerate kinase
MRILVCPDKFAGTLTASDAALAICEGWSRFTSNSELQVIPISDGGEGFLDSVRVALQLKSRYVDVTSDSGNSFSTEYAFKDTTCYIEVAKVVGINNTVFSNPDPTIRSSFAVGELIRDAIKNGFKRTIIGLGGTNVSDGGAGLLAALGAVAFDSQDRECDYLKNGNRDLTKISRIDISQASSLLAGISIEILTDVENPLLGARGAAKVFAPQKGADELEVEFIEESLTHLASVLGKRQDGKTAAVALGAGAAGGIGFALIHLGATRSSGVMRVMEILRIPNIISKSDLVITGEGKFDWQSLDGKAVTGLAKTAMSFGVPTIVLAGQVEIGRREWQSIGVASAFSLEEFCGLESALSQPKESLALLAERVARTWNR